MGEDVIKRMKKVLSRESARSTEMQSLSPHVMCVSRTHPGVGVGCVCRTLGELDVNRGTGAVEVIL